MAIKLSEIKSPLMEVEMPDGEVRRYDPFEVIKQIAPYLDGEPSYGKVQEITRAAFQLPAEITDYQVLHLIRELVKFVEESGAVKGLMPVSRN